MELLSDNQIIFLVSENPEKTADKPASMTKLLCIFLILLNKKHFSHGDLDVVGQDARPTDIVGQ
ncbi:MAG TPA: hypothetical protein VN649_13575 [Ramlibacter sp.]|nr:hypothetical protein [Ramlibacter sp.]